MTPNAIIDPSPRYTVCTLQEAADRLRIHPNTLTRLIKARRWPGVFFIGPKEWGYRIHLEEFVEALKKAGHKYGKDLKE